MSTRIPLSMQPDPSLAAGAPKGKRTKLTNRDLVQLIREHTADEIAEAHGITVVHVRQRLRDQGFDSNGDPIPAEVETTPRTPVVPFMQTDSSWVERAECLLGGYSPDLWHPEGRDAYVSPIAEKAKAVCNRLCPVREACLADKLRTESTGSHKYRHGIAGGMTPAERAALVGAA